MTKLMVARAAADPPRELVEPLCLGRASSGLTDMTPNLEQGGALQVELDRAQQDMLRRKVAFDRRARDAALVELIQLWKNYEHAKARVGHLREQIEGPPRDIHQMSGRSDDPEPKEHDGHVEPYAADDYVIGPISFERPSPPPSQEIDTSAGESGHWREFEPPSGQQSRLGVDLKQCVDTRTVEQQRAERYLVERLAAQNFAGWEYDRFIDSLARHGLAVIKPWIRTGYIFERCAARRVRGLPSPMPLSWSAEDIEELALDTVARGIAIFDRDALRKGQWRPDGGASLSTYFIGTCLFAFAEVYRRRYTDWQRQVRAEAAAHHELVFLEDSPDVADLVVDYDTVTNFLVATTPDRRMRLVAYLHYEGHTHAEIAAALADGTTARAVEGMLYRYRKQLLLEKEDACDEE
jgi:hypothetical protein